MASFGDALRGLGSVLNPQVARELAQEDAQKRSAIQQMGMFAMQQRAQQAQRMQELDALKQSPEYKAKQLALQREQEWQTAARAAQGDPVKLAAAAAEYKPELAVSLINQQESRAQRLQQAQDSLEFKKSQLAQQHEIAMQRITDAQERARIQAEFQRSNQALKEQGLALQREIAQSNADLKRMQFEVKADKELRTNVQKLGGALEKANLPEADSVLGAVERAIEKAPDLASYLSGPGSLRPDWTLPSNIREGRQAFQSLFNITLKNRSGAAVTVPEYERLKSEFGAGAFKTQKQIEDAVKRVRKILNEHYASVAAGFGPEVLEAYNENIRGFGGRVVLSGSENKKEDPLGIR